MKILYIEVEYFKTFHSRQRFTFEDRVGTLNLVMGENLAEPDLEGNGVGKSSLFTDAIAFALFGKTLRGMKASNAATWGLSDKGCEVTVGFETFAITRHWNPNSLQIQEDGNTRTTTQEEIDDKIGLSFEAFSNLITVGQFSNKFFDLRPAEKMEIFGSFLNLEAWNQASDFAKEKKTENERKMEQTERELDKVSVRTDSLQEEIQRCISDDERWQAEQDEAIEAAQQRVAEHKERSQEIISQINVCKKEIQECGQEEELLEQKAEFSEVCTELLAEFTEARDEWKRLSYQKQTLVSTLEKRDSLKQKGEDGGQCPECGQDISPEAMAIQMAGLQQELDTIESSMEVVQEIQEECDRDLKAAKEALAETVAEIQEYETKKRVLETKLNNREQELASVKRSLSSCEEDLLEAQGKSNPFGKRLHGLQVNAKTLNKTSKDLKKEYKGLEEAKMNLEFWIKGFREIRLMVLDQALDQFQLRVNNCLEEIGLLNWSVVFDIEKENKTGGFQRGFSAFIQSPHNDELVPWESWSGGESQRLRLAGNMGLIDFIEDMTGFTPNIEVWDEPGNFINPQGLENLLELFKKRAVSRQKQLWIIDHHSLSFGGFDEIVTIQKTKENGSIIVQGESTK